MHPLRLAAAATLAALALASPVGAQLSTGTIYGTVKDDQGGILPGATVTLAGPDRQMTFATGADGQYRFLSLPPGRYTLTVELAGFARFVRDDIQVVVGAEFEVPVVLRVGGVQETITVSGQTPVVDAKTTATATNFTQDELARIPTSRDPWALLRTVPGVVMDRVNIAGNETGQQSNFNSKGSTRNDTVWTLDGVVVTDMSAVGASPTYFDFDAFDEIQISTSGQDLRQATAGAGLNLVVKRGTNAFRGHVKGFYTGDGLEAENVPDELKVTGPTGQPPVTGATADHNKQISEYGFDIGGPILRDRAWFWGSWTKQDIRLVRSAGSLIDRTELTTSNVKGNWQATARDHVSVLWFLGAKEKQGRGTGLAQVEAPTATWNQGNFYPERRPHGLLKIEDNHVFSSNLFLSGKYAYYGTGFSLEPAGGLDGQASISSRLGQTFGTTRALRFLRPQHIASVDGNYFATALGGTHDIRFGGGWRRHDASSQEIWPGDMVAAFDNSVADQRARIHREAFGTNRTEYFSLYAGDTWSRDRLTVNAGVRYDRQGGSALPSSTRSNAAFPALVPGIEFAGYDAPFRWNDVLPCLGVTYALDEARRTLLKANFSIYASQLDATTVGWSNPTAGGGAGYVEYPWVDRNGDRFVQPDEVVLGGSPLSFGNGFNPGAPTAVTSANVIDPDLRAPLTRTILVGLERELMPNLALQVAYTWSRLTDIVGLTSNTDSVNAAFARWNGLTAADYLPGPVLSGTLPDGSTYSVPTFVPDPAKVAAGGNGRQLTNYPGYALRYNGIEAAIIKRLSNRWMARVAFAWNDPVNEYDAPAASAIGNPTRRDVDPLVDGGTSAPRSSGSGSGDVFVEAGWQLNVNGAYLLPHDMELAANLFGRQGNPFPVFRQASLGLDGSQRVLVSPDVDTFRFDDLWNLDVRWSKRMRVDRFELQLVADLFNVFNANTVLNRQRNVESANFQRITQNLSPRILRFGLRMGF
jgi:hypothetical protein